MNTRIERYLGPRAALRPLFELAEDSAVQLDSYLWSGQVLVALAGAEIVGHLQVIATDRADELEIKNMAVLESCQGNGIGRLLVAAAVELAVEERVSRLLVSTAAAGIGELRFYQRVGFRLHSIERDAFVPATGYPNPLVFNGIPLRDRVWLDLEIGPAPTS